MIDTLPHAVGLALPHPHTDIDNLILETLQSGPAVGPYALGRRLRELYGDRTVLHVSDVQFDVEEFARAGLCSVIQRQEPYGDRLLAWEGAGEALGDSARNAWLSVRWEHATLDVVLINWDCDSCAMLVAPDRDSAERFYRAVCAWNAELRGKVLVFDGHRWQKDEGLFAGIQGATVDNLVLAGTLKEEIVADLRGFFAARAAYQRYGIPWKRGILFLGPPGNGKTHAVKAVINALGVPCLYIKYLPEEQAIRAAFARARLSAPCLMVLEDLDALIKEEHRSVLLNELDGFAANTGIVTLATTNHPERLDPALIDRPSRFDRKYHFELPERPERLAYIMRWNATLQPELRISEHCAEAVADGSESFSYAYLKELFLSSTMRWLALPEAGAMDLVIDEQLALLRTQMASTRRGEHKG